MKTTKLKLQDVLPLTCTRSGTCCHGNRVQLNPWELFCLASEKKITTREFRDRYTEFGGIQLLFNGKAGWKGKPACSQYTENVGCSVHLGRPLACRLFPIGRQIQNNEACYIYQGDNFPCLDGCPEVVKLPNLSIGEYLKGQETKDFEQAQDGYLELMQNIADSAFEFFLDTGLAESGDTKTLELWKEMGNVSPAVLADRIGKDWMDNLMIPDISPDFATPISFIEQHSQLIQNIAQEKFQNVETIQEFHEASVLMMGIALQLARGIGANPEVLAEHWCDSATDFLKNKS